MHRRVLEGCELAASLCYFLRLLTARAESTLQSWCVMYLNIINLRSSSIRMSRGRLGAHYVCESKGAGLIRRVTWAEGILA